MTSLRVPGSLSGMSYLGSFTPANAPLASNNPLRYMFLESLSGPSLGTYQYSDGVSWQILGGADAVRFIGPDATGPGVITDADGRPVAVRSPTDLLQPIYAPYVENGIGLRESGLISFDGSDQAANLQALNDLAFAQGKAIYFDTDEPLVLGVPSDRGSQEGVDGTTVELSVSLFGPGTVLEHGAVNTVKLVAPVVVDNVKFRKILFESAPIVDMSRDADGIYTIKISKDDPRTGVWQVGDEMTVQQSELDKDHLFIETIDAVSDQENVIYTLSGGALADPQTDNAAKTVTVVSATRKNNLLTFQISEAEHFFYKLQPLSMEGVITTSPILVDPNRTGSWNNNGTRITFTGGWTNADISRGDMVTGHASIPEGATVVDKSEDGTQVTLNVNFTGAATNVPITFRKKRMKPIRQPMVFAGAQTLIVEDIGQDDTVTGITGVTILLDTEDQWRRLRCSRNMSSAGYAGAALWVSSGGHTLSRVECTGESMFLTQVVGAQLFFCHVWDTTSDQFHQIGGSKEIDYYVCWTGPYGGDDGFGLIGYAKDVTTQVQTTLHGCRAGMTDARGLAVAGGYRISVTDFIARGTCGPGILVNQDASYDTPAPVMVSINKAEVQSCGSYVGMYTGTSAPGVEQPGWRTNGVRGMRTTDVTISYSPKTGLKHQRGNDCVYSNTKIFYTGAGAIDASNQGNGAASTIQPAMFYGLELRNIGDSGVDFSDECKGLWHFKDVKVIDLNRNGNSGQALFNMAPAVATQIPFEVMNENLEWRYQQNGCNLRRVATPTATVNNGNNYKTLGYQFLPSLVATGGSFTQNARTLGDKLVLAGEVTGASLNAVGQFALQMNDLGFDGTPKKVTCSFNTAQSDYALLSRLATIGIYTAKTGGTQLFSASQVLRQIAGFTTQTCDLSKRVEMRGQMLLGSPYIYFDWDQRCDEFQVGMDLTAAAGMPAGAMAFVINPATQTMAMAKDFTAVFTAGNPTINIPAHGSAIGAPVLFTAANTLPNGIPVGTVLYVAATGFDANNIQVELSPGSGAITPTTAGLGTQIAFLGVAATSTGSRLIKGTGAQPFTATQVASEKTYQDSGTVSAFSPTTVGVAGQASATFTLNGVAVGDIVDVVVPASYIAAGLKLNSADVTAANTITVTIANNTAAGIDTVPLNAAVWFFKVKRPGTQLWLRVDTSAGEISTDSTWRVYVER